jgi:hypothetical protein
MLILVDGTPDSSSNLIRAAKALGHRVHVIPLEGSLSAADPTLTRGDFEWGVLSGVGFSQERYQRIHDEAREFNITLLNDPTQHRDAEELDRTVARLDGLTAKTEVVQSVAEVQGALHRIHLPVFIRGAVSSAKELGWKACVAETVAEAQALVTRLLALREYSRGRAVLREVLPLRRLDKMHAGFPLSREYRLFVLDADVLAMGPYWVAEDPFGALSERDESEIRALAHEVAKRTKVPWLAVDVGQLESGEWKVIETADPACSALTAVNARDLLDALTHGLQLRAGC